MDFHQKEATPSLGRDRVRITIYSYDALNTDRNPIAKQEDGNAAKNLKVWKTETAEEAAAFVQKSQQGWNLQYTYDEKYCARAVTNTVQFFESYNMNTGELIPTLRGG